MSTTFDASFQIKILTLALRDATFLSRCEGLLDPGYFDEETLSYLVDIASRHFTTYRCPPDAKIVLKNIRDAKAAGYIKDTFVDDLKPILASVYSAAADLSNRDFYADEVGKFARERALEAALLDGADILEKGGDQSDIERKVREALAVGVHEGTASRNFFDTVADRVKLRVAKLAGHVRRGVTTGYRELDNILYHKGWGKKELYLLLGAAKSGKSMGLAQFALNAYGAGFNVLYTTHENSAEVTLDRMDACMADLPLKTIDTAGAAVEAAAAKLASAGGCLIVEEFPAGAASVTDIQRVIRRYLAKGIKFDLLVCDYADELRAIGRHTDERFKLKEVFTTLRALATTEDIPVVTATQTNRKGFDAVTVQATDVGEDWSKVKIADAVISISATDEEKKVNQLRLYFAAMRNTESGITLHCVSNRANMVFIKRVVKIV